MPSGCRHTTGETAPARASTVPRRKAAAVRAGTPFARSQGLHGIQVGCQRRRCLQVHGLKRRYAHPIGKRHEALRAVPPIPQVPATGLRHQLRHVHEGLAVFLVGRGVRNDQAGVGAANWSATGSGESWRRHWPDAGCAATDHALAPGAQARPRSVPGAGRRATEGIGGGGGGWTWCSWIIDSTNLTCNPWPPGGTLNLRGALLLPLSEPSVVALDVGRGAPFVRRAVTPRCWCWVWVSVRRAVGADDGCPNHAARTAAPADQSQLDEALPVTGDQAYRCFIEADRLSGRTDQDMLIPKATWCCARPGR